MRVYFEKPRTTTGWKGLINDPHLDGSADVNAGLRMARNLLLRGARPRPAGRLRVPRPDHAAIHLRRGRLGGDRRPHHREPDPPPARLRPLDADRLQEPHRRQRPGRGRRGARRRGAARLRRHRRHAAPRRSSTRPATPTATSSCAAAAGAPNHDAEGRGALAMLGAAGLPERLVIDASHDNSGKDPERSSLAAGEIADQIADGNEAIVGVMLESFLVEGRQDLADGGAAHLRAVDHRRLPRLGGHRLGARAARRRRCGRGASESRIAVLGVGLIGGSIGLAARERLGAEVVGLRPDPATPTRAFERGRARSRRRLGRREACDGAELVFCAAPVGRSSASWPRPPSPPAAARARSSPTSARPSARSSPRWATTSASSAATRWPAPRPPGSTTPAPTSSRALAGT